VVLADLDDALSNAVEHLLASVSDLLSNVQDEVVGDLEFIRILKFLRPCRAYRCRLLQRRSGIQKRLALFGIDFPVAPRNELGGHDLQYLEGGRADVLDALDHLG
jgi:hypothetical protein